MSAVNPEPSKRCRDCQNSKPLRCFMLKRNSVDGRSGQCQSCWQAGRRTSVELAMSPIDVAWIAGLLEGEGSFRLQAKDRRYSYGEYGYPMVQLSMTDEDVVRRALVISGLGCMRGPYRPPKARPTHKDYWIWSVSRSGEAIALMNAILPLMGSRRTGQIEHVLAKAGFHAMTEMTEPVSPSTNQGGERSAVAKLTQDQVGEIRVKGAAGVARKVLAAEYGIHLRTLYRILSRETWR